MSAGRRMLITAVGSLLVMVAGAVPARGAVATAAARQGASTSGPGFFPAGAVDLDQPETVAALLFDTDGLIGDLLATYPHSRSGLDLIEGAETGDPVVLSAEAEPVGGNESQGMTTELTVVEARP